jgi:hypothetical protein
MPEWQCRTIACGFYLFLTAKSTDNLSFAAMSAATGEFQCKTTNKTRRPAPTSP